MKRLATIGVLTLFVVSGCPIPRDPHPERTPSPVPTTERPLQSGRQPAPSQTCELVPTFNGELVVPVEVCTDGRS